MTAHPDSSSEAFLLIDNTPIYTLYLNLIEDINSLCALLRPIESRSNKSPVCAVRHNRDWDPEVIIPDLQQD